LRQNKAKRAEKPDLLNYFTGENFLVIFEKPDESGSIL